MIVYWILLLITAFIAYCMGSLDSVVLASNFVFRRDLRKLGKGNIAFSNFRRIFGPKGFVKLLLVELVKDLLPILIGGWLLEIRGHAEVGRAFAGFCLVLGRLYPAFYGFRGSHGIICMLVAAVAVNSSVGIAAGLFMGAALWFSRYVSLGAVVGALMVVTLSVLLVDNNLSMTLCAFTGALVLIRHIPAISRLLRGKEQKLSFEEDISYKFDQKF